MRFRIKRKPKFDARTRADLNLHSVDDLRRIYQVDLGDPVRMRDSILKRQELRSEIEWRVWRESLRFWLGLIVGAVGTIAAIVAAWEGWLAALEVSARHPIR